MTDFLFAGARRRGKAKNMNFKESKENEKEKITRNFARSFIGD